MTDKAEESQQVAMMKSEQSKDKTSSTKPNEVSGSGASIDKAREAILGIKEPVRLVQKTHEPIFPEIMMDVLEKETSEDGELTANGEKVFEWLPLGKAFIVRDRMIFQNNVVPKYFGNKCKFLSFTRKLYRWGFKQVDKQDPNGIVFMHHLFIRGEKQLCRTMKSKASTQTKKEADLKAETIGQQQFYANLGINMQGTMSQQDMMRAMSMMLAQQGGYPMPMMPNQAMMMPNNQAMPPMMPDQSMPMMQGQANMSGQSMTMPNQATMTMNMIQGQVLPAQGQLTSQPGLQMSQMEQQQQEQQQNQMQQVHGLQQQNGMVYQAFPSSTTSVAAISTVQEMNNTQANSSITEGQSSGKTVLDGKLTEYSPYELASEILNRNPGMSQKRALSLAKEINNETEKELSEGHKV